MQARRMLPAAAAVGVVAAAVVATGYLAGLGCELTVPASAPQNAPLAAWLQQHHFTAGLGPYWASSSITVETGNRVQVRAMAAGKVRPYLWMADTAWYDPARHTADFVVTQNPSRHYLARLAATFGPPVRSYHADGFTILAWDGKNLLADLSR